MNSLGGPRALPEVLWNLCLDLLEILLGFLPFAGSTGGSGTGKRNLWSGSMRKKLPVDSRVVG